MVPPKPSIQPGTSSDDDILVRSEEVALIEYLRAAALKLETASGHGAAPQVSGRPPPLPMPLGAMRAELKRMQGQITATEESVREDFQMLQNGVASVLEHALATVNAQASVAAEERVRARTDLEAVQRELSAATKRRPGAAFAIAFTITGMLFSIMAVVSASGATNVASTARNDASRASDIASSAHAAASNAYTALATVGIKIVEVSVSYTGWNTCASGICVGEIMNGRPLSCNVRRDPGDSAIYAVCANKGQ